MPLGDGRHCALTRIHLEEDAGKLVHTDAGTLVDLNRAGAPLIEIVGQPELHAPADAHAFLVALREILRFAGVSDCDMELGSLRCDANISLAAPGARLGTKVEIKNLNSFKMVQRALEYEERRQTAMLATGARIVQETRLWNDEAGETRPMRSKEFAEDYRYFPDPDLPPLVVSDEDLARIKAAMPELPGAKCDRFISEYGLSKYDATLLSQDGATASYFETAVKAGADAKLVANWMLGEVAAALNREEKTIEQSPVNAVRLSNLVARISDGTISHKIGKTVFDALWSGEGASVDAIIDAKGLRQISDSGAIEKIVDEVLAKSAAQIADYKSGKEKALMSIVGQVMKASQGKANPAQVNEIVRRKLLLDSAPSQK